ncbi:Fatty acid desaturase [Alphaproteobacteria bacterium SO-S41]|nr:Fatty acid desaturase [Alphaproteobacteria bacterium SO-S41]
MKAAVSDFQRPTLLRSLWQIANSFAPLVGLVIAMYYIIGIDAWWSYPLTLALGIVAGGFVVRIFIIQHDCGHGSFFRSDRANSIVGLICGVVTFTPFANWRRQHAGHHATWNNLDRRDTGVDIYSTCNTVEEYRAMSGSEQWRYRLLRHPVIYLMLIPPLVFLVIYRLPFDTPRAWLRERLAVHLNNAILLALFIGMGLWLGFGTVLAVQIPIIATAAIVGVFLFSVQHRFEATLWARGETWNAVDASLKGSSFLKLPRVLQWFTGNIGFHHIHHLNSRVPNYRLQACHEAIPEMGKLPVLTLGAAFMNARNALWDERSGRMVSFRQAAAA